MTSYIEQIYYLRGLCIIPLQEKDLSLQKGRTDLLFSGKKSSHIENTCITAESSPYDQPIIII